jgi:hypothetical protein
MLQMFHLELVKVYLNVVYVAMAIHACAQEHVSSVSFIFRRMLQVCLSGCAYAVNGYVAIVCSKCFIYFRCMLQLFHLSVAKVYLNVGVEKV